MKSVMRIIEADDFVTRLKNMLSITDKLDNKYQDGYCLALITILEGLISDQLIKKVEVEVSDNEVISIDADDQTPQLLDTINWFYENIAVDEKE